MNITVCTFSESSHSNVLPCYNANTPPFCVEPFCHVRDITVSCCIDYTDKCVTGDDGIDCIDKCVTGDDGIDCIDKCVTGDDGIDCIDKCVTGDDGIDCIDKCVTGDDCVDYVDKCVTSDDYVDYIDKCVTGDDRIDNTDKGVTIDDCVDYIDNSNSAVLDVSKDHGEILPLQEVKHFKSDHPKNLIIGHYNVNSIRHKIYEITPLLEEQLFDILAIAETKIDDSFPHSQFHVPNYKLHRQDRNSHGGGIMIYVNDSIPHRLLKEHSGEFEGIDFLTLEITVKSYKWILVYIYRPPRVNITFQSFPLWFIWENNYR